MSEGPPRVPTENKKESIVNTGKMVDSKESWVPPDKLRKELNAGYSTVKALALELSKEHPGWIKGTNKKLYSPELALAVKAKLEQYPPPPEGWLTWPDIQKEIPASLKNTIKKRIDDMRESHPDSFREYRSKVGVPTRHASPELISEVRKWVQDQLAEYPLAAEGWIARNKIATELGTTNQAINKIVEELGLSDAFKKKCTGLRGVQWYYSPAAVSQIRDILERVPRPPDGWETVGGIKAHLKVGDKTVADIAEEYREAHPEWFKQYKAQGGVTEHLSPELIFLIRNRILEGRVPESWMTANSIRTAIALEDGRFKGISETSITKVARIYSKEHPEWTQTGVSMGRGRGMPAIYYSSELANLIRQHYIEQPDPPEGWLTNRRLTSQIGGVGLKTVYETAQQYKTTHPEWFGEFRSKSTGRIHEYYAPELVQIITEQISANRNERQKVTLESLSNEEVEQIKKLAGIFGASNAVDILYAANPRFKGMPVEQVESMLADYLGNYLLEPGPFDPAELGKNIELLGVPELREGLRAVIKEDALKQCYKYKEENPDVTGDAEAFADYFRFTRDSIGETGGTITPELDEILRDVEAYYGAVLAREMPDHVVGQLTAGRPFPDLYQRINIQELKEKKRLLIADEMGVGKSGSAILAAESLGLKTVLAVVPNNVIPTWQGYLSDRTEVGAQVGYFKPGQAPRVLVVDKPADLKDTEGYDYILISQERLSNYYADVLKEIDYDMLIVDEVHRLKNLRGGARAQHLLDLVESAQGRETHMALLSGTPVPNKVEDVAILLKLLHPDRFGEWDNTKLISSIIHGDLQGLRALLLPYMQMKELGQHIEMPKLNEDLRIYELSEFERDAYEVLLEEDELTPMRKMQALRQFLLNPRMLNIAPEAPASKIAELQQELDTALEKGNKVVVFSNSFTDKVLAGTEPIMSELRVPPDVTVEMVHGGTSPAERARIQTEFQSDSGRVLLLVSGQTADVGVDYSRADHLVTYNEPWTEAARRQQLARAYRPGRTGPLQATTLIAKGTIEEGMHEYIKLKHQAIEKLLKGIPINELEQNLLEQGERMSEPDLEVSPELAKYYFSSLEKLNKMFAIVKESGEERFRKFLEQYGEEYATCYQDLGSRSYQSNASRISATLLSRMIREAHMPGEERTLDIASGPEMLKRHALPDLAKNVVSLDRNKSHFNNGTRSEAVVGSFTKLPFPDNSFDYANFALALHYTRFVPSKGIYERAEALHEMRRVLKPGGRAIITLVHSVELKNLEGFRAAAANLGLEFVDEYSGTVSEGGRYEARVLTLEKRDEQPKDMKEILPSLSKQELDGLKLVRKKTKLKDSRKILSSFELGGKIYSIVLNEEDQRILAEERATTAEMKELKGSHGSIERIPPEVLRDRSMVRLRVGKKHILFKKLSQGGVVIEK